MNLLAELKRRFAASLSPWVTDPSDLLAMVRPSQDPRFGDYQANCAMPFGKRLGKPPREIAQQIVEHLDVADICEPPEIAGPGFINLRLRDDWLTEQLNDAQMDERAGVGQAASPRAFVIDYSSPNVAKPMHVGHIRSTVIGDALCRILRFLGHRVISDNHLGDWGTQFGMIIYGFKHFGDRQTYEQGPVEELSRIYQLVNVLVDYHTGKEKVPDLQDRVDQRAAAVQAEEASDKPKPKVLRRLQSQLAEAREALQDRLDKIHSVESDPPLSALAQEHSEIARAVLRETARLHAGDADNVALWEEFLPPCRTEIQRIYDRLDIQFDYEYGESYYDQQLPDVVSDFQQKGLARESEGAVCVFADEFDTPMIIQKKDGAFLYATTDLATIQYRMQTWAPNVILYVVDHRQGEHFKKLFQAARCWGYDDVELTHIRFGTVRGDDGRPFKTRSGETVGLEGLLDEAVQRAYAVVCANDDAKPNGSELVEEERKQIAESVGIAALKYADLSQNRTSDYTFSYDKMLALNGNTATYMQYSYARVQGIFARGNVDIDTLRASPARFALTEPDERALGIKLLGFAEALDEVLVDYRPNLLTNYLFELTKTFFTFYENCPVLRAEQESVRHGRLLLCDLTARMIRQGLAMLGIRVVDRM
ncbi:MAG: arginine--tRNA ligase [Pirellulaceae bacterium]